MVPVQLLPVITSFTSCPSWTFSTFCLSSAAKQDLANAAKFGALLFVHS